MPRLTLRPHRWLCRHAHLAIKSHHQYSTIAPPMTAEAQHQQNRLAEIQQWHTQYHHTPYTNTFKPTISFHQFANQYQYLAPTEKLRDTSVKLAGRIVAKRQASGKLAFIDIVSDDATVQVLASLANFTDAAQFPMLKTLRRGDVVGVTGYPGRSKAGELSLIATDLVPLSPCLNDMPDTLTDLYTRFTQRSLDFLVNGRKIRETLQVRAIIVQTLRNFLVRRDYIEVETPILWPQAGGALAKPFVTRSHSLSTQLYMRIAPELFLKQLVIGGFNRVFELSKVFRNEGVDATHNPEFTTVELYEAYSDYQEMMTLTHALLLDIVKAINRHRHGTESTVIIITNTHADTNSDTDCGSGGDSATIDFAQPFRRIDVMSELKTKMGLTTDLPDPNNDANLPHYLDYCRQYQLHFPAKSENLTIARILDKLIGKLIEPECQQPTFLCNHPVCMSPLARKHSNDERLTERFELFIMGHEFINSYSELNDWADQRARFHQQSLTKDEEAHVTDEEYLKAMEWGLPPTAGWGMGVDRLTMLLTGNTHIREVLLFPIKRTVHNDDTRK